MNTKREEKRQWLANELRRVLTLNIFLLFIITCRSLLSLPGLWPFSFLRRFHSLCLCLNPSLIFNFSAILVQLLVQVGGFSTSSSLILSVEAVNGDLAARYLPYSV